MERDSVSSIHKGYFSVDKNGKFKNSEAKGKEGLSDDVAAYDLILSNKERLLSFDEPTRFIFSHSALREGWDNPNVFQICYLKEPKDQKVTKKGKTKKRSDITRRQEVGRGLRLCVNKDGERQDNDYEINLLTVIKEITPDRKHLAATLKKLPNMEEIMF